jgi:hypothetical protein
MAGNDLDDPAVRALIAAPRCAPRGEPGAAG